MTRRRSNQMNARWQALLDQRCPRCLLGDVFTGAWSMAERCSRCGYLFKRERGYFQGAALFRLLLGVAILTPFSLMPLGFLSGVGARLTIQGILLAALASRIHRYALLLFMYLDTHLDPPEKLSESQQVDGSRTTA